MKTTPAVAPEYAEPDELARRWHTTTGVLAKQRYLGTGPEFLKLGRKILYPWRAIYAYEEQNTRVSTGAA